jgi:four helix bundle protein
MKVKRFEDLKVWQLSRELVKQVSSLCSTQGFRKDHKLHSQLKRAAVSIMANIAEGFGRKGDAEFLRFLYISRGSASEVRSHLCIALDLGYITEDQFQGVYSRTEEVSKALAGLIRYLKSCQKS